MSEPTQGRGRAETPAPAGADLLTTKELADYLRLNERTVLKLAAQGELPGARLGNQWRFRRAAIDTWLDNQMLGVRRRPPATTPDSPSTFELRESFRPEHVIAELRGDTVPRVLEELCARAAELELVRDRTWFLGALIERENVLSSAVGQGIAFPHTLHRHPEQVLTPFLLVGRSADGVDFAAADRERVHLIVLMGLRYQELHLPWLGRLSWLLRDPRVRARLAAARTADEIHAILARCVDGGRPAGSR